MKKELKGFVCGIVTTAILGTGLVFAAGQWKTIDVLENDITVMVDGQQVTESNFVYNDRTYLPLRAVAEAVGKPVEYDEAANTAYIGDRTNENSSSNEGNIISVTNTYQTLTDGVFLYDGADGVKYVKIKEANGVAYELDGLNIYSIRIYDDKWVYEKYDAVRDVTTNFAEGPVFFDIAGDGYMKADDFIATGLSRK